MSISKVNKCNCNINSLTCSIVLGTDGAASMVGQYNGVGAILRREHPDLITVGCTNHALQNACSSATKPIISKKVNIFNTSFNKNKNKSFSVFGLLFF